MLDRLENGFLTTGGYGGTVFVPKAGGGCALVFPAPGTELCSAFRGRDGTWRCQLERRLSEHRRDSEQQFSHGCFSGKAERIYGERAHGRNEHAVAVRAEQLHEQPATVHETD